MSSIELRQLRYFEAVAEERHFGRAADRLRIAQPGLSQQIKGLERMLGVALFIRTSTGVRLTEAGEALVENARLVIELAERAAEHARLALVGKKGLFRIGIPAEGIYQGGRDLLSRFHEQNPEAQIEIQPGYVPRNLEALARHTLDAAIVVLPCEAPKGMRYARLGMVELLAAVPRGHPLASVERISRSDLGKEPFLDWPESMNPPIVAHLHRVLFGSDSPPRPVPVADVMEMSRLVLVARGVGIAVLLSPLVTELEIPQVVFRPLKPAVSLEYGVAWLDAMASPFGQRFVDVTRQLAV